MLLVVGIGWVAMTVSPIVDEVIEFDGTRREVHLIQPFEVMGTQSEDPAVASGWPWTNIFLGLAAAGSLVCLVSLASVARVGLLFDRHGGSFQ